MQITSDIYDDTEAQNAMLDETVRVHPVPIPSAVRSCRYSFVIGR
jgi:hypothetical protein